MLIVRCYCSPQGKERGISFGLACLMNLRGVFVVVVMNEDLTTGPGVVGELPQHCLGSCPNTGRLCWQDGERALPAVKITVNNAEILEL